MGKNIASKATEWNGSLRVWWSKLSPFNTRVHFLAKSQSITGFILCLLRLVRCYCLSILLFNEVGGDTVVTKQAMCALHSRQRDGTHRYVTFDIGTILFTRERERPGKGGVVANRIISTWLASNFNGRVSHPMSFSSSWMKLVSGGHVTGNKVNRWNMILWVRAMMGYSCRADNKKLISILQFCAHQEVEDWQTNKYIFRRSQKRQICSNWGRLVNEGEDMYIVILQTCTDWQNRPLIDIRWMDRGSWTQLKGGNK